jgi:pimeloyl-ACP methyl ester carboxylesterase
MASLVQDVWLGFAPRRRGKRLGPWEQPPVRLLFHLDAGATLDDPTVASFLEALAERVEVVAWEPRGTGGSGGELGPEVLEDAGALAADGARRFGELPVVIGGHGLGAWVALALAETPGVAGTLAVAPCLAPAGAAEPPSPLRQALARALGGPPRTRPCLVAEGRARPAAEARAVAEWLAREPRATHLAAEGGDEVLLSGPWPATLAAWAAALGAP